MAGSELSSREAVFAAMRSAAHRGLAAARAARPPYVASAASASVATLAASLEAAGARLARCDARELAAALARIPGLGSARHVWSSLPEAPPRGVGREAAAPHDLAALDFALLRGEWIVAESGAVWHVPGSPLERAAALLAEHVVIAVPESRVVATLHDAYARTDVAAHPFGWFLAGPSKTADIEQALVLGAHGPCAATVLLLAGA